jgi:hypothetical protein
VATGASLARHSSRRWPPASALPAVGCFAGPFPRKPDSVSGAFSFFAGRCRTTHRSHGSCKPLLAAYTYTMYRSSLEDMWFSLQDCCDPLSAARSVDRTALRPVLRPILSRLPAFSVDRACTDSEVPHPTRRSGHHRRGPLRRGSHCTDAATPAFTRSASSHIRRCARCVARWCESRAVHSLAVGDHRLIARRRFRVRLSRA